MNAQILGIAKAPLRSTASPAERNGQTPFIEALFNGTASENFVLFRYGGFS